MSPDKGCVLQILTVLCWCFVARSEDTQQTELRGWVGSSVSLPCSTDTDLCGSLHSIKWYRGSSRIYIFSDRGNFSNPEGEYTNRATMQYVPSQKQAALKLSNLSTSDEAVYKCEITYMDVVDNCHVVQFIHLTTLVRPSFINVTKENGELVPTGANLGPYNEEESIVLTCSVGEGKPVPHVAWYNGSNDLGGTSDPAFGSNVVGIGKSILRIDVSRDDLYTTYECRATSEAISDDMSVWFKVHANVKPLGIKLDGSTGPVIENSTVTLTCRVNGGRPKPTIVWYNDTEKIENRQLIQSSAISNADDTYDYIERLTFMATRYENNRTFFCQSTNEVMEASSLPPLQKEVTISVHYPPAVEVISEYGKGDLEVNRTMDVLLNCSYDANPQASRPILWYLDGDSLEDNKDYNMDETFLMIKNISGDYRGRYTCNVENTVAQVNSTNSIFLDVLFPPTVMVEVAPSNIVREADETNVTLSCSVESGNPENLSSVTWFYNQEAIQPPLECSGVDEENPRYCSSNLTELVLIKVDRLLHGNYSCQGKTKAGSGPVSNNKELVVYYPPGKAELSYSTMSQSGDLKFDVPVKGDKVVLKCDVSSLGRPENVSFLWYRGESLLPNVTSREYRIPTVGVQTKTNFSCQAVNAGGKGEMATVNINVYAPPAFHHGPPPYFSASVYNKTVNVSCTIECYPQCTVFWKRNNEKINPHKNPMYIVQNEDIPENPATDDFQAVRSTLIWNLTAWPGQQLDIDKDNANYTCESTGNHAGKGVKGVTVFRVNYPPRSMMVTHTEVNVKEENLPPKVICDANAYPGAQFHWRNDSEPEKIFTNGPILSITSPMMRYQSGYFTCNASNSLGYGVIQTYINVMYKPICSITDAKIDDKPALKCSADANPSEVEFFWKKDENTTTDDLTIVLQDNSSYVLLDNDVSNAEVYYCTVNNSVGESEQCKFVVPPSDRWWLLLFRKYDIKIILAVAFLIILLVILLCVIIIFICRKRRKANKYNNHVDMPNKQSYDTNSSMQSLNQTMVPKWPLKPGVLVHVNTNHSLNSRRFQPSNAPHIINTSSVSRSLSYGEKGYNRGENENGNVQKNGTQRCRAHRIKCIFGEDKIKYKADTLQGVFLGDTGVMSFKRCNTSVPTLPLPATNPRKRKKTTATVVNGNNRNPNDPSAASNEGLKPQETDKAFYENLPFHGMQNPPNKPKRESKSETKEKTVDKCSSLGKRPSSEQSLYDGSSGYGSTRSQLTVIADSDKFSSLRSTKIRTRPQFRSLRAPKIVKQMMPITETTDVKLTVPYIVDETPKIFPKTTPTARRPTMASEKQKTKHTYQNVPIPISPNNVGNVQITGSAPLQKPQITTNSSPMEYMKLTSSNNSKHRLYNGTAPRTVARPSPPPKSFQSPPVPPLYPRHPPANRHTNNSLLYADLTLDKHRRKHSRNHNEPNIAYQPSPPPYSSDYAVKFHDVGREIDV